MLVIDGNMKNRRDICGTTEAGFVEYEGLLGAIKTGCQLSLGYQSRYCYHHAPRVSTIENVIKESDLNEGVVKFIIVQKQTRNDTYYQVRIVYNVSSYVCTLLFLLIILTQYLFGTHVYVHRWLG